MSVRIVEDLAAVGRAGAQEVLDAVARSGGEPAIALSGGSTPSAMYAALRRVSGWERSRFFWGDERNVPPDHAESNFGRAWRELLGPAGARRAFRGPTQLGDPARGAREDSQAIRAELGADRRFGLVCLGIG